MEKSIFQIAFDETIVFSSEETDVIISFSSNGLRWWSLVEENKFTLSDTLNVHNDLNKVTIGYVRKLALDWFEWELNEFAEGNSDSTEHPVTETNNSIVSHSSDMVNNIIPLVEPLELDFDKKDAHTEHCCARHRICKYGNRKCTVLSGKKKPSYPCTCELEWDNF